MVFHIPADTEISLDLISDYVARHKKALAFNQRMHDAYENDFEIYHLDKKDDGKPDNRVSVNYIKYIIDTFGGFFCGIPIKVSADDEAVADYIEFLDAYNDQDDNNAELAKQMDIDGDAFEMYYADENGEICITYLSSIEAFMLCDESILERPKYFIRWYKSDVVGDESIIHGSWSDENVVQHFSNRGGVWRWEDEPTPHGFAYLPAVRFKENGEGMGLCHSILPINDAYNKALSEKANDVDYFADAYLKILGAVVQNNDVSQIKRNRIINFDSEGETLPVVDFLEKPQADETQENLLDRLETAMFVTSMVANISDENFGNASGVSLKYKLQAMSNLAKTKERKFASGMNQRYKIIFSHPLAQIHGISADDWVGLKYQFTQNYPANVTDEIENARNAEGILSHRTQLEMISVVESVDEELERIDEETEEAMMKAKAISTPAIDKAFNEEEEEGGSE